jgi:hypothetical protein
MGSSGGSNLGGMMGGALGGLVGSHMPNAQVQGAKKATAVQEADNNLAYHANQQDAMAGIGDIWNGYLGAQQQLGTGLATANSSVTPFYNAGLGANSMLQNALGLNGAAGNTAATNAFHTQPGYQWALGQGANLVTNNAAANGLLNSTQFANSLTGYGQGMANQQYNNWEDRLTSMSNAGQQAGGMLSNNAMNTYGDMSKNSMSLGQLLNGAYSNLGENQASMFENQGNIAAGGINQAANAMQQQVNGYMGLGAYLGSGGSFANMFKGKGGSAGGNNALGGNTGMVSNTSYANDGGVGMGGGESGGLLSLFSSLFNR